MPSTSWPAARCLDALLRFELAAIRCYQFAEAVLLTDQDPLNTIRQSHEFAAATLQHQIVELAHHPSTGPGLWTALPTLVEAATTLSARWAVLTVLLGAERHGIETYLSACRIPALPPSLRVAIESALLPLVHRHVLTLEQLTARKDGEPDRMQSPERLA